MAARSIVYVLLDFFIASLELEARPDLRGKPVIVGGDPRRRGLVVAVSPEAAAAGLGPGMPVWQALQRCPQAVLVSPHPDLYQARSQMALGVLSLYGDQVEQQSLDCFYLSIVGEAASLATEMRAHLAQQVGVSAAVGVAANKATAGLAARACSPGGLQIVPPGQEAAFVHPLPLAWLVGDSEKLERLQRLGLRTIGDLAAVPEHQATLHLGAGGKTLLRHAQGKDGRAVRATQQRLAVEWEHVFEHIMLDRSALRRWVVYLAGRIGQDIRSRKQRAHTLTMTLGRLDAAPIVLSAVLPKATDLDRPLRDTALQLVDGWDGRSGVMSLGIEAGVLLGEPIFQMHLFDEAEDEREESQRRLDHAKNGLNRRFGQGTVMAAMLLDDEILAAMGKHPRRKG